MHLDLQDSFLEAACGLPKEIGKKVWKAIRIMSRTPSSPGLNLEKLRGKADDLWSIRVDEKYRTILYRDQHITRLLFVGPEQDAYLFAERVPTTGHATSAAGDVFRETSTSAMEAPPSESERAENSVQSRTAKYVPLARYLLNLASTKQSVTLSFSQIEEILGADLPPSARRYRPWWGNDYSGHVQASAWLSVGWKVAKVSVPGESVTFDLEGDEV